MELHGTVGAYLIGASGDVIGLALTTGEQVRFSPRVGETLTAQSAGAHPEVTVAGAAVRSDEPLMTSVVAAQAAPAATIMASPRN